MSDGARDIARAAAELATRVPEPLAPLARLAYDYRWSWAPGREDLFRRIDPERFELVHENPVRLLLEASQEALDRAATDPGIVEGASELERSLAGSGGGPGDAAIDPNPVAFFCAEFGIHRSLPIYSGGLGVLAGDILKEASDLAMPMVGVGLMYAQGSYHQRLDPNGWQHDYWVPADPARLPAALVTGDDGSPLTVTVPIRGRIVMLQVWRVEVGRVPLYLMDAGCSENDPRDRWITARLYVGEPSNRLSQYAVLGIGGMRALTAMGIRPRLVHLNEGHPALATVELARMEVEAGRSLEEGLDAARARGVFTTHTPVPAGNETYGPAEASKVLGRYAEESGIGTDRLLALGKMDASSDSDGFGMTTLGLRMSHAANGVSRIHGEVARKMWRPLFPDRAEDDIPITDVTNAVHLPTWMAPEMADLFDRHLGPVWRERAADPEAWEKVDAIPDEELWDTLCGLREGLATYLRARAMGDRLAREEPEAYVEAAATGFDPDALTFGFARRVATYKRLNLLTHDEARVGSLLSGSNRIQIVLAGKAHPKDEDGKRSLRTLFRTGWQAETASRVAYLEDYDMGVATRLVWGCDVWLNLPRAPYEASGTSGMKSAMNGGLNLSVLDGWWAEAFDGTNGWGIDSPQGVDAEEQDARDAAAFYDLLEREVLPLFFDRDEHGIPRGWVGRVKASLRTIVPRFCATRMMQDYRDRMYRLR